MKMEDIYLNEIYDFGHLTDRKPEPKDSSNPDISMNDSDMASPLITPIQ